LKTIEGIFIYIGYVGALIGLVSAVVVIWAKAAKPFGNIKINSGRIDDLEEWKKEVSDQLDEVIDKLNKHEERLIRFDEKYEVSRSERADLKNNIEKIKEIIIDLGKQVYKLTK
jgi:predicted transcriptional regulator